MSATMTDQTQELLARYRETKDPAIRERLVGMYARLVRCLAIRFAHRGEPLDDLIQVGSLALVKAIDRYDASVGATFSTYATPTIVGEIKRYFRDLAHTLRIPRSLQELRLAVNRTSEQLLQQNGRVATIREIAEALGVTEEQVLEADEFSTGGNLLSLDIDMGEDNKVTRLMDFLGQPEAGYAQVDDRLQLKKAIGALTAQQRAVVYLRYYAGLSQAACAEKLGVSQMQVSRIQINVLARLRAMLEERVACA